MLLTGIKTLGIKLEFCWAETAVITCASPGRTAAGVTTVLAAFGCILFIMEVLVLDSEAEELGFSTISSRSGLTSFSFSSGAPSTESLWTVIRLLSALFSSFS